VASPAAGQTFLPDPGERASVAIQLEKPLLIDAFGLGAFSSILEVDAILPLGSASLQVGVPVAFAGADFVDGTSVYAGNLRATILFGEPGSLSSFIGITLPTASNIGGPDFAVLVGLLPWLGELEKWLEETVSLRAAVLPSWPLSNGGRLGLRLGGAAILPNGFDNLNVDARVAGWARLRMASAELGADLATSYMVTSDDGFGEQFTAYLALGATLVESSGAPGVFIRIPLDGDGRRVHDLSIGLSVRF
jgi:hypothetical protein